MHVTILARCTRVLAVALGATAATGLVFALAGVAAADHDDVTHFPAESMTHGPFAAAVEDPSAFGGKALRYADPGRATRSVALPSEGERVVIRARNGSDSGRGSAVGLRVTVDGKVVGEKLISSASYAYHSFDAGVPKGTHEIGVEGYSLSGKDRAYLDAVRVVHQTPDADADADGVPDASDNCPSAANPTQANNDGDAQGDACDPDDDDDGRDDGADFAPFDPDAQDPPPPPCKGKVVSPGDDLDAIVNSDPATTATTFCIQGGTYHVSETLKPRSGDKLIGEEGVTRTITTPFGPVTFAETVPVTIRNGGSLAALIGPPEGNVEMRWLDVSGAQGSVRSDGQIERGTGVALSMGRAGNGSVMEYMRIHDNDAIGVGNMHGRIAHSQLFRNSNEPASWGHTAASVKGITEFVAEQNFMHDEQGNGLWLDHVLSTSGNVPALANGGHFKRNIAVDIGRWGLRYEYASRDAAEGQHMTQISFLAEENLVASSGFNGNRGGASMHDAQNGTFRSNVFGAQVIDGVQYGGNYGNKAIQLSDSYRSDRTDLFGAVTEGNDYNGEEVTGCNKPLNVTNCKDSPQ